MRVKSTVMGKWSAGWMPTHRQGWLGLIASPDDSERYSSWPFTSDAYALTLTNFVSETPELTAFPVSTLTRFMSQPMLSPYSLVRGLTTFMSGTTPGVGHKPCQFRHRSRLSHQCAT